MGPVVEKSHFTVSDIESTSDASHHRRGSVSLYNGETIRGPQYEEMESGAADEKRDIGPEGQNQIEYKTLTWKMVAALMIAEVVSNGMLGLTSGGGVIGIIPTVIFIAFFGLFGTFTGCLLVQFKLNHPDVLNLSDAGQLLFGSFGRELFTIGKVTLVIMATSGQLLVGQMALKSLSNHILCAMVYVAIFAAASLMGALPRTLGSLTSLSYISVASIVIAGIIGMIGAGQNPIEGRTISAFLTPSFEPAFSSILRPIFAYGGHFIFFVLISEMIRPQDAFKAVYVLQGSATSFYLLFTIVTFYYLGDGVASPSFLNLPERWQKVAWGIAIPKFLVTACLTSHAGAKLLFVRIFRGSKHLHSNTITGWTVWALLVAAINAAAFALAVSVPIFNSLIGLAAALFASWTEYGLSAMYWLHDAWFLNSEGAEGWKRRPLMAALCLWTVAATAFICVAGMYVTVKSIVDEYHAGTVGTPFVC